MDYNQALKIIINSNSKKFRVKTQDGNNSVLRLFVYEQKCICYYKYKSRTKGYPYNKTEIDKWINISPIQTIDINLKVKHFMQNVIKYLTISGLWEDLRNDYQNILNQGDEYLKHVLSLEWSEQKKYLKDTINASFYVDDIVCSALKGIVSITYPKYEKDELRRKINGIIHNDCSFSYNWRDDYDSSVTYKMGSDNKKRGWYSKEYKNMLNGHYYLALDERRAIFCEND